MNSHKNTALALVTGILFGGHLFLLAPLTIYFANHNEFSIELSQILLYLLTASAVSSVFVFALILVLHKKGYVRLVAFVMGLGLYLYIQFYYLVWNYGIFDGREMDWNQNADPRGFRTFRNRLNSSGFSLFQSSLHLPCSYSFVCFVYWRVLNQL